MRITERRLRAVIKQVIAEINRAPGSYSRFEHYDRYERGMIPDLEEIERGYFGHLVDGARTGVTMSPEEWADENLSMNMYANDIIRRDVMRAIEKAEMNFPR